MSATIVSEIVEFVALIKVSIEANNNKFWNGRLLADGTIWIQNGRVGTKGQDRPVKGTGKAEFARRVRNQMADGYQVVQTIDSSSASTKVNVKHVALSQIEADDSTKQLIEYLSHVNIHNVLEGTNLIYQGGGNFATPLGVVNPTAIAQARQLLNLLEGNTHDRCQLLNNYLMLIPQSLGRQLTPSLFSTPWEIQAQLNLLDSLESVIPSATTSDRIFDCSLNLVPHTTQEGQAIFRQIEQQFESTLNPNHTSSKYKLKHVYEIQIPSMASAFESSLGNVQQLWHGTRASNLVSILKQGLIIPPSSATQCTGRMFGNGVYFSNQSTKSLNYATEFWNQSGTSEQRVFMLLANVAVGRDYRPKTQVQSPPKGYDSVWVEPRTCGVLNHECVVYRLSQVCLRYLCECHEPRLGFA